MKLNQQVYKSNSYTTQRNQNDILIDFYLQYIIIISNKSYHDKPFCIVFYCTYSNQFVIEFLQTLEKLPKGFFNF